MAKDATSKKESVMFRRYIMLLYQYRDSSCRSHLNTGNWTSPLSFVAYGKLVNHHCICINVNIRYATCTYCNHFVWTHRERVHGFLQIIL
jgi:hypothetical protein